MTKKVENNFDKKEEWDTVILPESESYSIRKYLKSIVKYKDLIFLLVRRDFVSQYKQTILGPLWFFISPILSTFTFFILLSKIGKVDYANIPPVLFIFSGFIFWNYFSENFIKISETFISNVHLFGKVYFPRAVIPFSVVISGLYKLVIQFVVLLFSIVFYILKGYDLNFSWKFFLLPVLVALMALYTISFGLIVSSITVKYRDLRFLIPFLTQLLMFFSSVVYDISSFSHPVKFLYHLNPFTDLIEGFRECLFGNSEFKFEFLAFHFAILLVLFFISMKLFFKREKNFLDTI